MLLLGLKMSQRWCFSAPADKSTTPDVGPDVVQKLCPTHSPFTTPLLVALELAMTCFILWRSTKEWHWSYAAWNHPVSPIEQLVLHLKYLGPVIVRDHINVLSPDYIFHWSSSFELFSMLDASLYVTAELAVKVWTWDMVLSIPMCAFESILKVETVPTCVKRD